MGTRCRCDCGRPRAGQYNLRYASCFGAKKGIRGARHCHHRQNSCEK